MTQLYGPSVGPAAGGQPKAIVVLLHGVGADGRDLIELAPLLAPRLPHALFVAPDAPEPCDMAAFGRQWFSLQDRRPEALLAGVRRAAPVLDAWIDGLLARHALDASRLALLGFSQGAMMALHVGLRRNPGPAAILGFSGALVGTEALPGEVLSRPPVMLIHGDADDVVPFAALFQALEGLQAAGIPVQWIRRPGLPHSIDPEGLDAGGRFLAAMLEA
jgi:phospholipase/carboxylesterase